MILDEVKASLNTWELQGKKDVTENGTGEGLSARGKFDEKEDKKKK